MKRSLLAVSLLLTVPAFAQTLKEAQDKVNGAQSALEAEQKRREQLAAEIQSSHQATKQGVGEKHASVMEQQQAKFSGTCDSYNQCVARCQELQDRVHQAVSEAGKEHTVVSQGEKFSVQPAPKGNSEPIVRRSASSAPYSAGGEYNLANR
jgi:hypothetical protein